MLLKKTIALFFLFYTAFLFGKTAEEFISEADKAEIAENWEKTLELLQEGIKQYPKNDTLLLKLGIVYYDKELYASAYKLFKKGLALNAENVSLLYYISSAAGFLNNPEEANAYIKKYLK